MAQSVMSIVRVAPDPSFDPAKFERLKQQDLRAERAWNYVMVRYPPPPKRQNVYDSVQELHEWSEFANSMATVVMKRGLAEPHW